MTRLRLGPLVQRRWKIPRALRYGHDFNSIAEDAIEDHQLRGNRPDQDREIGEGRSGVSYGIFGINVDFSRSVQCGFYLRGPRRGKSHLNCVLSVYSNSENAIEPLINIRVACAGRGKVNNRL